MTVLSAGDRPEEGDREQNGRDRRDGSSESFPIHDDLQRPAE
jgi:hypothetical protein